MNTKLLMQWGAYVLVGGMATSALGDFKDGPHFAYPMGGDVRHERAGFGWQVAYGWSPYCSAELSVTWQEDKLDDLMILPTPFDSTLDLEVVNVGLTVRGQQPIGPVNLYGGVGLGYYFMRASADRVRRSIAASPEALPSGVSDLRVGADLNNTFGYHWSLGVEYVFHRHWDVFAEYRFVYLDSDITYRITERRTPRGRVINRQSESFPYDHRLLRAGINYRF